MILRERLLLVKEQAEILIEKIKELEEETARLRKENAEIKAKLEANACAEEFMEHRGALFKRKREGGYHLAVYCPVCRMPAGSLHDQVPYSCEKPSCLWVSSFNPSQLDKIIKELSA